MMGGGNEGFIPGFGRPPNPQMQMMNGPPPGMNMNGPPPGMGGGMGRRGGPLPSQQDALERVAGPGAGGQRRWGGQGQGGGRGGSGSGGGGLPY